jgi:uncharacterized membrane protein affecting hemolysin expression
MDNPIFIVAVALCLIVVIILALGLGVFVKGGQVARNHSNRLMRYRLIAQAVAVLFILIAAYLGMGGK